ncbi:MAG: SufD family Fe-S cluster assembly protein, partial [Pseudomonadota bacterium]
MGLPEVKADGAEGLLGRHPRPTPGAKWAEEARSGAAARLRAMGAPVRRDEYWKYTDPRPLVTDDAEAALFDPQEAPPFDGVDRVKLVFVDGVFDPAQSDDPALAGVEIEHLADALAADIHWARDHYGVLEERGQVPVPRPLAALNTAVASAGVVIRVTAAAEKPVSLRYLHESENSDAVIHHVIKVEAGAALTLLESGPAAARFNKCMEVEVADGAEFHHVRAQGRDNERKAATAMFVRLGRESVFKSFTLTVNGVLTRNEAVIEFTGDDA